MLIALSIKNFAIISELSVHFESGMTTLTGETGAGKSIIIDALSLLTGGRGSVEYLRAGADKAVLEGLFSWSKTAEFAALCEELGIEQDDELTIQRELFRSGKSVCRVNGHLITITNLKRLGAFLVDIQGQTEHQDLLQPEKHLGMLDALADPAWKQDLADYQRAYEEYRELEKKYRQKKAHEQDFAQRLDMLKFQIDEIENAHLVEGEEEQLSEERDRLANFQKIADAFAELQQFLSGENAVLDLVGQGMKTIDGIQQYDSHYQSIYEELSTAYYALEDALSQVDTQVDQLQMDPGRLEEIEGRLELIRQLERKYGATISEVIAYYQKISTEFADSRFLESTNEELGELLDTKKAAVLKIGNVLADDRHAGALVLAERLKSELTGLYMGNIQFEVRFAPAPEGIASYGLEQAEFYIATNVGEGLKPLAKVASGGELSRVLLALKTIFSKQQVETSIVFDEVDSGVSGRVAQGIANKIYAIGLASQVLCITHLPQVAAMADQQYLITKQASRGRTETTLTLLSGKRRVHEIARMLAGDTITELTEEHAQELLALAEKTKQKMIQQAK
ncbi:DNA repair protein RecN [Enterococcus hirae]|nr:DNA repair protein RecN [Enterococcus hirae]